MVKTWGKEKGPDFTCECGAVYEVTVQRFPGRDSDKKHCSVCRKLIASWNDTYVPTYTLKFDPRQAEEKGG